MNQHQTHAYTSNNNNSNNNNNLNNNNNNNNNNITTNINHYSLRSSHSGTVVIGGIDFHRINIGKRRTVKFTLANTHFKPFVITNLFLQQSAKPIINYSPNRTNNNHHDKTNSFNYTLASQHINSNNNNNHHHSPLPPPHNNNNNNNNNNQHQTNEIFQILSNFTFPIIIEPNDELESLISFTPPFLGRFTALLSITSEDYPVPRVQQILLNGEGDIPSSPSQIIYTDNQVPIVIDTPKNIDFINPLEYTTNNNNHHQNTNIFKTPGGNLLSNINNSNNSNKSQVNNWPNSMPFYDCDIDDNSNNNNFIYTQYNNQIQHKQQNFNNINQNNHNNNHNNNINFTPPNGTSKKEKKSVSFSPFDEISYQDNQENIVSNNGNNHSNNNNNTNNISDNYINNRYQNNNNNNINNTKIINNNNNHENISPKNNNNLIDQKFQQLENKILELSKKINQSNSIPFNINEQPFTKRNNNQKLDNNNNNNNDNKNNNFDNYYPTHHNNKHQNQFIQQHQQPVQVETINNNIQQHKYQPQFAIPQIYDHRPPPNNQYQPPPPQQDDDESVIKLSESGIDLYKDMQKTPLPKGQTPAAIRKFLERDTDDNFSPILNRFDQAHTPFFPRTKQHI